MNIFLADLQNSYYGAVRNSVPINIGFIGGYLKKVFGDEIQLHMFREFEEMREALKTVVPHVAAFGSYSWNTSLTLKTARFLKDLYPEIITAVGGADVSPLIEMTVKDLQANRQVDFYIPNEGETPMKNLVETCISKSNLNEIKNCNIKGCLSLDYESGSVLGSVIDRFEDDINAIPSPYFDGLMDRFLYDPAYLPIIQSVRGCPYHCTFCVSGKKTWSKVKLFDLDRIKAEIDYIADRTPTFYLRFAEENFGFFPRDLEIAEYVMELKHRTGFPSALSIYTDKHPTELIMEIQLLLKDLLPFCISFQSTTPQVLKNIKRHNLREDTVRKAINFARKNDILPVTELIFALPGETKGSFLASVDKLVEYRFENIVIGPLRILKGTEMDQSREREKYGFKTMFSMSENGYTINQNMENIEIDEWVVANDTLTENEYFDMIRFLFIMDFVHFRGFAKELLFFFINYGIRTSKLIMEAKQRSDLCPVLCAQADNFESGIRERFHRSPGAVRHYVRECMSDDPESLSGFYTLKNRLIIEILVNGRLDDVIQELAAVGRQLYHQENRRPDRTFDDGLESVCDVLSKAFIPLDQPSPREIKVDSIFDLNEWDKAKHTHQLEKYRMKTPKSFVMKIREMQPYHNIWSSKMSLLERFNYQFAVLNSSNLRRFISVPTC